ncbi:Forkhead-associated protein [Thalassoporum mexicanum PCC 7367]|uniref:FHA domain-containing protein n=1 Tax=Thalassoporum mexicanum TaxID=3457544 RepID=UPI00029FD71D|nr:FHA domain-containing protein [Pseudanabaena sp. PCC 7367]AFY71031.1 Forkhead-associated protein [Pseudanabaena sp. PCC 7367]
MDIEIKFKWHDQDAGTQQQNLKVPVAIGKEASQLPTEISNRPISQLVLAQSKVSRYHALIEVEQEQLVIIDQNSTNGVIVNGRRVSKQVLNSGDRLGIGDYTITVEFNLPSALAVLQASTVVNQPSQPTQVATELNTANEPEATALSANATPTIELSWEDPATGEGVTQMCQLPVVMGREVAKLPLELDRRPTVQLTFSSLQVSRYHALIDLAANLNLPGSGGTAGSPKLAIADQNSSGGTFVNEQKITSQILNHGDVIRLGPYQINVAIAAEMAPSAANPAIRPTIVPSSASSAGNASPKLTSTILFNPSTGQPDPNQPNAPDPLVGAASSSGSNFPPPSFQAQQVAVQDLHATGLPVSETVYGTVGAGLGSYILADYLRISGVPAHKIMAIGLEPNPYARYQRLCLNSQIPPHERLRSNSDSCPDNLWGWPSYALREAWHDFGKGKVTQAWRYLWQVFAEPTFSETYTPRAGNVFDSIDREAKRIGWDKIYHYGRVLAIRKTNDNRYGIAYSLGGGRRAFVVCNYLHLAIGYAALKFLDDLQAYRASTGDFRSVVNAYEQHDHVYEELERNGGTIIIRGRGIVASRIVQRIHEARKKNSHIMLVHLMRSPKSQGNKFGTAQRPVEHHYEFQPFNWPKACWGGDLRVLLESASAEQRKELIADWGGTTTADRGDWKMIVDMGIQQGWYQIRFGTVEKVEKAANGKTITHIRERGIQSQVQIEADFIVDATGLDANVEASPLMADLVDRYHLPINPMQRLAVENDFEVAALRNGKGKVYVSGAATLGGPYAAVDSFLGLQYSAQRIVDGLVAAKAPNLKYLNGFGSFAQWLKWVNNRSPD